MTSAVLLAHLAAWQLATDAPREPAPRRAGIARLELVPPARQRGPAPEVPDPIQPTPKVTAHERDRGQIPSAPHPLRRVARVGTGAGGKKRTAPADAVDWPVYPTRPSPSATLHYALAQGAAAPAQGGAASELEGRADIEWHNDAGAFSLRVATQVADRPPREWVSVGLFDAAGVAPTRFVEREHGRDKRAINFDHDGARVRFSGASVTLAIAPGAQDRWSWVAQLAAIAEAQAQAHRPASTAATQWDLQVAGLRGDLERWTFKVLPPGDLPEELRTPGNELSTPGARAPALLHVLRATARPYDLRIEAWLSPVLHHLPAGLRMSTPPGPWSLSLWRRDS